MKLFCVIGKPKFVGTALCNDSLVAVLENCDLRLPY